MRIRGAAMALQCQVS